MSIGPYILLLPDIALERMFSFLSYDEIARNRLACLSIDNYQRVMILGQSKDFGTCKTMKKNGEPCTAIVNTNRCEHCIFHVKQEYQKCSNRSDLQANFSGRGLTALRNKVLGKNEVFYAGKSYTAIPAKRSTKLIERDGSRLSLLSGANKANNNVTKANGVAKRKQAAHVELSTKQKAKDLELLRKLGGTNFAARPVFTAAPSTEVVCDGAKNTELSVIPKLNSTGKNNGDKINTDGNKVISDADVDIFGNNRISTSGVALEESAVLNNTSKLKTKDGNKCKTQNKTSEVNTSSSNKIISDIDVDIFGVSTNEITFKQSKATALSVISKLKTKNGNKAEVSKHKSKNDKHGSKRNVSTCNTEDVTNKNGNDFAKTSVRKSPGEDAKFETEFNDENAVENFGLEDCFLSDIEFDLSDTEGDKKKKKSEENIDVQSPKNGIGPLGSLKVLQNVVINPANENVNTSVSPENISKKSKKKCRLSSTEHPITADLENPNSVPKSNVKKNRKSCIKNVEIEENGKTSNLETNSKSIAKQRCSSTSVDFEIRKDKLSNSFPITDLNNGNKRNDKALNTSSKNPQSMGNQTNGKNSIPFSNVPKLGTIFNSSISLANVPKLGSSFLTSSMNKLIDLNSPAPKRKMDKAKQSAIQWVQRNGPIEKTDPNKTKRDRGKKRPIEIRDPASDPKKQKIQTNEFFSDRFKKMMAATSKHADLLEQRDNEEREKYFDKLEMKERMEDKMMSTYKVECKAVRCLQCKYTSFSASDMCKQQRHPLKVFDAVKRFFRCGDCGNRTVTLNVVPTMSCKNCSSGRWERTTMMKEKTVKVTHSLSIRGGEQTFVNSVATDANINLMVPDE